MDHSTMEHMAAAYGVAHGLGGHGMGPAWMGVLYVATVLLAIACHIFNLMRPEKLARLPEAEKDARANRMERNMIYVCASHIPMGLAWIGWLAPFWGVLVGACMLYGEAHLAFRSYQRAKQVYAL